VIGAIVLGILAGYLGRLFTRGPHPRGILLTMLVGIAGSLVGYLIFTEILGIGDTEALDLGGLPGAVIGTMILLVLYRRLATR
jgi:uncharacterized membrane protein YeaQ/YmgE (transglycosylase-associated protein family)